MWGAIIGGGLAGLGSAFGGKAQADALKQDSWFESNFGDEFGALGAAFFADLGNMDLQRGEIDFTDYQNLITKQKGYLTTLGEQGKDFFASQYAAIDPATSAVNDALQTSAESTLATQQAQNDTSAMSTGNSGSSQAALEAAATTAAVQSGLNQQITMNTQKGIDQKSSMFQDYTEFGSDLYGEAASLAGQQYKLDGIIQADETLRAMNASNPAAAQLMAAQFFLGGLAGI